MPFLDTNSLPVIERLPGWHGRYFHSQNMTFAHYDFTRGSSIHEHFHPEEEVYEVIEGELEVAIDGVSQIARAVQRPGHHRRLPATAAVVVLQQVFRGAGPRPAAASQAASFGCGAGVHANG